MFSLVSINSKYQLILNRIREILSFELIKEIEKDGFCLVTSVGQRKNSESPRGIEPQTFGFRAPMLYHFLEHCALEIKLSSFTSDR